MAPSRRHPTLHRTTYTSLPGVWLESKVVHRLGANATRHPTASPQQCRRRYVCTLSEAVAEYLGQCVPKAHVCMRGLLRVPMESRSGFAFF